MACDGPECVLCSEKDTPTATLHLHLAAALKTETPTNRTEPLKLVMCMFKISDVGSVRLTVVMQNILDIKLRF